MNRSNKIIGVILIISISLFSIIGCSDTYGFDEHEELIYTLILENVYSFKNPSSVRVVQVTRYSEKSSTADLRLSAQNSFGATTTKDYVLYIESMNSDEGGFPKGTIITESKLSTNLSYYMDKSRSEGSEKHVDVSKINKALRDHWEDEGFN